MTRQPQEPTSPTPFVVLIVTSDPALSKLLKGSLKTTGFVLAEAASGQEALDLIRRQRFDLALLDLNVLGQLSETGLTREVAIAMDSTGLPTFEQLVFGAARRG